jgi:hypothetical protein
MTLQIPGMLPILILEGAVVFPGAAARLEADEAGTKLARSILRTAAWWSRDLRACASSR